MAVARFSSLEQTTPCMSATLFLTMSWISPLPMLGRGLKRLPTQFVTSFRNVGCIPKTHTNVRIRSESYYLSMEFLIGRSLANNVTNLLLDPVAKQAIQQKNIDWLRSVGAGARCRARKRGTWAPGSLFPRLLGDHAVAGHGLWFAL